MTNLRIGQVSDNVANLFSQHLAGLSWEDKKWLCFSYDEDKGILSLLKDEKKVAEVKVKIFTFLVPGIVGRIDVVSPGAYYTNLYLEYGLEDEVKEYRASIIKKLLVL
jgi:hypothetical protein